jgi:predicted nucleic acid-binding protein
VSVFADSSFWFATIVARDEQNERCKVISRSIDAFVTSDHVVVETWLLLNSRYHRRGAELFWERMRRGAVRVEMVTTADMEAAWAIGERFVDQQFSLVDRTSFAVMERLGLTRVASFDRDFAIYRYGRDRNRAFEVLR